MSSSSSFGLGILAATIAPSLSVLGFFVWDNHWTGSTYALNMYKCNLGAIGFASVVVLSTMIVSPHNDNDSSSSSSSVSIFEGMTQTSVGFLMLSSTIGILIGDWTWLEGLRILGVRKVIVMDCLKPFLAAFVGKVFLGEQLTFLAYIGLALTMGGVTIIGLERTDNTSPTDGTEKGIAVGMDNECIDYDVDDDGNPITVGNNNNNNNKTDTVELDVLIDGRKVSEDCSSNDQSDPTYHRSESYATQRRKEGVLSTQKLLYGTTNAILNVLLHTFGALLTKMFGTDMTTWQINLIRFGFAGLCMLLMSSTLVIWNQSRPNIMREKTVSVAATSRYHNDPWYCIPSSAMTTTSWIHVSLGVVFVSFLCPALNNYAMFQVPLALLLTLESIGPLYSLPLSWVLQGDRPTFRAYLGVVLAISGIVILSFKGLNTD